MYSSSPSQVAPQGCPKVPDEVQASQADGVLGVPRLTTPSCRSSVTLPQPSNSRSVRVVTAWATSRSMMARVVAFSQTNWMAGVVVGSPVNGQKS